MAGHYERLSGLDSAFLVFEDTHTPMHLGGVLVVEAGPLARPDGGVDVGAIRQAIAARLHNIPRYRQRLARFPLERHPVWVDDPQFNIEYHVRHTALPKPGDEAQLKLLVGRVMSQPLDRRRPLWEVYVIESLARGRFALLVKVHHCLADGVSAIDLITALLSPTPDDAIPAAPAWTPRRAPSRIALARDELEELLRRPLELATLVGNAVREPGTTLARVETGLTALLELLSAGLRTPAEVPTNGPIGPFRRVDWLPLDLAAAKGVKNQLGGTVNDVVLAVVTGAVRRYLLDHHVRFDHLGYKAVVPVSVRREDERGTVNNRVSAFLVPLPIAERDVRRRYRLIRELTARSKASGQHRGAEVLTRVADWAGATATTLGTRLTSRLHPYNLIVTNVPGPPVPLYLLGARVVAGYPLVPLFENQGFGVAIFSYDQRLFLGFNADWDRVPDLDRLVAAAGDAFRALTDLAARARRRRRAAA